MLAELDPVVVVVVGLGLGLGQAVEEGGAQAAGAWLAHSHLLRLSPCE